MDHLIFLYASLVLTASGLAGIAIWAPRPAWVKASALALCGLLIVTGYVSLVDLLGRPKAAHMEWARKNVPEATVLAVSLREKVAIYLWLSFDGEPEPRAYALPWSMKAAQQLQQAMQEANAKGTAVRARRPFEPGDQDMEMMFYAQPQETLPPKVSQQG